jgi:hypothetical protein
MRTYSATTITRAALTLSSSRFPPSRTTTSPLVPANSNFAGQLVIQTGTVTINERDGDITVSHSFTYE